MTIGQLTIFDFMNDGAIADTERVCLLSAIAARFLSSQHDRPHQPQVYKVSIYHRNRITPSISG